MIDATGTYLNGILPLRWIWLTPRNDEFRKQNIMVITDHNDHYLTLKIQDNPIVVIGATGSYLNGPLPLRWIWLFPRNDEFRKQNLMVITDHNGHYLTLKIQDNPTVTIGATGSYLNGPLQLRWIWLTPRNDEFWKRNLMVITDHNGPYLTQQIQNNPSVVIGATGSYLKWPLHLRWIWFNNS